MRFALYHGQKHFAADEVNKFVVLEDDLILSTDFYSWVLYNIIIIIFIIIIKNESAVQGWEKWEHSISPKTPTPHNQPIEARKKK